MGINVRIAADSTMLRMVNLLIALSFGVHLEQLEQRIGFTCPRPFLLRPLQIQLSVPILFGLSCESRSQVGVIVLGRALLDHFCGFCRFQLDNVKCYIRESANAY